MKNVKEKYGIAGYVAPALQVPIWIDKNGKETAEIKLADYNGKFKVIYCFQAWCPGCHNRGLPALQEMVKALEGNDKVTFLAIQTVFEGFESNTFEEVKKVQKKYKLEIPFGHDVGSENTRNISSVMYNFRTGGTPWFILIDENNGVVFNDFHLNTEKAIEYLKSIK